ncbi:hypothetical protein GBA52_006370 [Prunus armeniaca]|nr:hypothetical protein GBA52_006265 [Prunus armeniaca]KAH0979193.1 hypothetical protein GBA52_006370 [Prunus armeniaca]
MIVASPRRIHRKPSGQSFPLVWVPHSTTTPHLRCFSDPNKSSPTLPDRLRRGWAQASRSIKPIWRSVSFGMLNVGYWAHTFRANHSCKAN